MSKKKYYRQAEKKIWDAMKYRCLKKSSDAYPSYGGRGITICKEWLKFENFIKDMGLLPSSKYSLERIDNNKNYEPSNCKWATQKEQCRNKRSNVKMTYNGETKILIEWAEAYNLTGYLLMRRLYCGWDFERALLTPKRNYRSV